MKWIKWTIISGISNMTGKSVVNLFGATYIVADKFVRRIR